MAQIQSGVSATDIASVDPVSKGLYTVTVPQGVRFAINGLTGTIGATANGEVFAMKLDPSAPNPARISRVKVQFRTIVAFTTPGTFRALRLRRFSGTAATGGTAITVANQNDTNSATSEFNAANGGDMRVSATAVLGAPGTIEAFEWGRINLANFGAALATTEWLEIFDEDSGQGRPRLVLRPGQGITIGTTAAFDAAGTWEANVFIDWSEGAL